MMGKVQIGASGLVPSRAMRLANRSGRYAIEPSVGPLTTWNKTPRFHVRNIWLVEQATRSKLRLRFRTHVVFESVDETGLASDGMALAQRRSHGALVDLHALLGARLWSIVVHLLVQQI